MVGDTRDRNAQKSFSHQRHVATQANGLVAELILRGGPIDEPTIVRRYLYVTQRPALPNVCRFVGESDPVGTGRKCYAGADEDRRRNQEESVRSPLHGRFSSIDSLEAPAHMFADRHRDCKRPKEFPLRLLDPARSALRFGAFLYVELRRMAARYMGQEGGGKTLQTTLGGLSVEETAAVLKISPQSVMRDWKLVRAWLLTELAR